MDAVAPPSVERRTVEDPISGLKTFSEGNFCSRINNSTLPLACHSTTIPKIDFMLFKQPIMWYYANEVIYLVEFTRFYEIFII